ncbi:hypothetical protein [Ferrimonas sp. YFM]|uniref:hypothetical protein n=1 Tax=Ferrimonas sp. YFM TaxID=3028878 RepID=UPI0025748F1B|nr:hypothetical protein [Ferrimonas sp. YFM]
MKGMVLAGLMLPGICCAEIVIQGQVTDKLGEPVSKCDVYFNKSRWISDDSIHVRCDEKGRYEARIPAGLYNSMYVCDEDKYGKIALEFWGWNLNLMESQEIDAAFDTLEVFSLSAWSSNGGSNSMFASFRPMSLVKPGFSMKEINGEQAAVIDIAPELDSSSIRGFVDGKPVELLSYNWAYEKLNNCKGFPEKMDTPNGCYMPMVIAQFKKPKLGEGQHLLKVRLVDAKTQNLGEGITHFSSNSAGFGF